MTPDAQTAPSWQPLARTAYCRHIESMELFDENFCAMQDPSGMPPKLARPAMALTISEMFTLSPLALGAPPDEVATIRAEGQDPWAVTCDGRTRAAIPIAATDALLIARLAASFGTLEAVDALATQGKISVLEVFDILQIESASLQMRRAFLPQHLQISTHASAPHEDDQLLLLGPLAHQGIVTKAGIRHFEREFEKGLDGHSPMVLVLGSLADTSRSLRKIVPEPISLVPLSAEIILMALTVTHSATGRIDRDILQTRLPADRDLRQLDQLAILSAFRGATTYEVAARLVALCAADPAGPGLEALQGMGEIERVARRLVQDLQSYEAGLIGWVDMTRGLLMTGETGTGKTYAAECIARAANVAFIPTTIGEWQSTGHLGDMLGALRASFASARAMAPCILFVDEIDSLGSRNSQDRDASTYRQQVINEFLAQVDGIGGNEGVILIGATNHPEALDPAILRPGRLDKIVALHRPGLAAIRRQLSTALMPDIAEADLDALCSTALGLTPAAIAAALREARSLAREAGEVFAPSHLLMVFSPTKPDLRSDLTKRIALHETGHAIIATALAIGTVVEMRIQAQEGEILLAPAMLHGTLPELQNHLVYNLAGRAAEQLFLGEVSAGAGGSANSDLAKATHLALKIEHSSGLGQNRLLWEPVGPIESLRLPQDHDARSRLHRRLEAAQDQAIRILDHNRADVIAVADALAANRILFRDDISTLLAPIRMPGHTVISRRPEKQPKGELHALAPSDPPRQPKDHMQA